MGGWPGAVMLAVHATQLPKGFNIRDLPYLGVSDTVHEGQLYRCRYDPENGSVNVPAAYKQPPSDPEAAADAAEQKFRRAVPAFMARNAQFVDMRVQSVRDEAKAGQAPWAVMAAQRVQQATGDPQDDGSKEADDDDDDDIDASRTIVGYCLAEVWGQACVVMSTEFMAVKEAAQAKWNAEVAVQAPGAEPQLYFIGGSA